MMTQSKLQDIKDQVRIRISFVYLYFQIADLVTDFFTDSLSMELDDNSEIEVASTLVELALSRIAGDDECPRRILALAESVNAKRALDQSQSAIRSLENKTFVVGENGDEVCTFDDDDDESTGSEGDDCDEDMMMAFSSSSSSSRKQEPIVDDDGFTLVTDQSSWRHSRK
jgi:hypothetical protein